MSAPALAIARDRVRAVLKSFGLMDADCGGDDLDDLAQAILDMRPRVVADYDLTGLGHHNAQPDGRPKEISLGELAGRIAMATTPYRVEATDHALYLWEGRGFARFDDLAALCAHVEAAERQARDLRIAYENHLARLKQPKAVP